MQILKTGGAVFSRDRRYRYLLTRGCTINQLFNDKEPFVMFIMLNPSVATALVDDATIRRCMGFTRKWGFKRMAVVNIFGLRSTNPGGLRTVIDPVGPKNNYWIVKVAEKASKIICAWGNHGDLYDRGREVVKKLDSHRFVLCFGITSNHQPAHPLRLPYNTGLKIYPC